MARIDDDDDGCFDWELVPDPPAVLAKDMDTYYPWLGRLLLLLSKFVEHGVEDGELGSDARRGALHGV
jgi:hypothetical protein